MAAWRRKEAPRPRRNHSVEQDGGAHPGTGAAALPLRTQVRQFNRSKRRCLLMMEMATSVRCSSPALTAGMMRPRTPAIGLSKARSYCSPTGATAGKERESVALGRRLIARSTLHYWRRWEGGKIVQHILRQPGKKLPERDALGYNDRNEWDIGLDGEPQDPWQETRSILFEDPSTAELNTFVTTSGGGRSAVVTLGDQIWRVRAVHADAVPLVELQAAEMKTQHGPKSKPVFRVVQWLTTDGTPVGERSVSAKEAKRLADDREMGDEIPF